MTVARAGFGSNFDQRDGSGVRRTTAAKERTVEKVKSALRQPTIPLRTTAVTRGELNR